MKLTLACLVSLTPSISSASEEGVVRIRKGEQAAFDGFLVTRDFTDEYEACFVSLDSKTANVQSLNEALLKLEGDHRSALKKARLWRTIAFVSVGLTGGVIVGLTVRSLVK